MLNQKLGTIDHGTCPVTICFLRALRLSDSNLNAPLDKSLPPEPLLVIGWREWLSLPQIRIRRIKAKVDTGARSSCLHAPTIETFQIDGQLHVRFSVQPIQRNKDFTVTCEAKVHDQRLVRSSNGEASERYVIQTSAKWLDQSWPIELTLADRSEMGFRLLLGREAIRGKMLVDSARSYLGGKPQSRKKK